MAEPVQLDLFGDVEAAEKATAAARARRERDRAAPDEPEWDWPFPGTPWCGQRPMSWAEYGALRCAADGRLKYDFRTHRMHGINLSALLLVWGGLIDHDLALTPAGSRRLVAECASRFRDRPPDDRPCVCSTPCWEAAADG